MELKLIKSEEDYQIALNRLGKYSMPKQVLQNKKN